MTALFCLALVILLAGYLTAQQDKAKKAKKPKSPPRQPARDVLDDIEGR